MVAPATVKVNEHIMLTSLNASYNERFMLKMKSISLNFILIDSEKKCCAYNIINN